MYQTVSLSSKRQITVPSRMYDILGLRKGQKLIASIRADSLVLTPVDTIVAKAAGMIKVSHRISNKKLEDQIKQAREQNAIARNII